jgi:hypothetical protein
VPDAARELFIEHGYAVTTVADIARRARVAVDTKKDPPTAFPARAAGMRSGAQPCPDAESRHAALTCRLITRRST